MGTEENYPAGQKWRYVKDMEEDIKEAYEILSSDLGQTPSEDELEKMRREASDILKKYYPGGSAQL